MNSFVRAITLYALLVLLFVFFKCTEKPGSPGYTNIFDPLADYDDVPPLAIIKAIPDSGIALKTDFTFDASQSKEEDHPDAKLFYRWDFNNDGRWDTAENSDSVAHYVFPMGGGDKTVRLLVRGAKNLYSDTSISVFVNTQPQIIITWQRDNDNQNLIHFDASLSHDFEDGKNLEYRWDFNNDGSWDVAWNNNPFTDHEFSNNDWLLKVEVRDTHHLVSDKIILNILPFEPVAYYPFNGDASDNSGNNNATVYGASLGDDRFGNDLSAYYFNGVDNWIDLNIMQMPVFSVSFWFNGQSGTLISTHINGDNTNNFFLELNAYGCGIAVRGIDGSWENDMCADTAGKYTDSIWHFVTFTNDNGIHKLYVDGVLLVTLSGNPLTDQRDFILGKREDGDLSAFYKGSIDEVSIYDRVLNESQIQVLIGLN